MNASRVPVSLVTGFLGAGKSTFVNALLREPAFAGTLVIVNEFGEVGLDHLLVSSAQDQVLLLDSGCLCCAISGTLKDTLIDVFSRRAAGSIPAFDRVIVETSGLANPAPMIASLLGDSALTPRCTLELVLALVDAAHGLETLSRHHEAQRQVALSDRLLISKTDTATEAQIEALAQALAGVNATASIERWRKSQAAAPHFAAASTRRIPQPATALGGLNRLPAQYAADENPHGGNFGRIATHTLRLEREIDWSTYAAWTDALRRRFGARLLRCKGLLRIQGSEHPWVVQGVQGYFAPPQRLESAAAPTSGGFLVFIGEGIARTDLLEALETERETHNP